MNTTSISTDRPALAAVLATVHQHEEDADVALARLTAAGLYPWATDDEYAPHWFCKRCAGTGAFSVPGLGTHPCRYGVGHLTRPLRVTNVVAVASLGVAALVTAHDHANEIVGGDVRIVWRVVDADELLRPATEERVYRDGNTSIAYVVAHEASGNPSASPLHYGHGEAWPEAFPWLGLSGDHVARNSWRSLRSLALYGFHVVNVAEREVTLAVVTP